MSSGSEQRLPMDELMELNRPAHMRSTTAEAMPVPSQTQQHPTDLEWSGLLDRMELLERYAQAQTEYLRMVSSRMESLPTQAQAEELLTAVKQMTAAHKQVGKKNEKHFSLPKIRLPQIELPTPRLSWLVGILVALAVGAVLWVLWYSLATVWNFFSALLP